MNVCVCDRERVVGECVCVCVCVCQLVHMLALKKEDIIKPYTQRPPPSFFSSVLGCSDSGAGSAGVSVTSVTSVTAGWSSAGCSVGAGASSVTAGVSSVVAGGCSTGVSSDDMVDF